MKLLLFLMVLCLIVVSASALNSNFQNSAESSTYTTVVGDGSVTWIQSGTGANNYYDVHCGPTAGYAGIFNTVPGSSTYFAANMKYVFGAARVYISYPGVGSPAAVSFAVPNDGLYHRSETIIDGTGAHVYLDGVLQGNAPGVSAPATQVTFAAVATASDILMDDIVFSPSSHYVLGLPESATYSTNHTMLTGFRFVKDVIHPTNNGLQNAAGTLVSAHSIISTFSKDNPNNETVYFKNLNNGVVYGTAYTGSKYTGTITWNGTQILINSGAPYGAYVIIDPSDPFSQFSNTLYYDAAGAGAAWGSSNYIIGQTGQVNYFVDPGYFDLATYTYQMEITDISGTVLNTTTLFTNSGTVSYVWPSGTTQGIKIAQIRQTSIATPSLNFLIAIAYTTVNDYLGFSGHVYDAQTTLPLNQSWVNFTQLSTTTNNLTIADGNYSTIGWLTGAPITVLVSKSGYTSYTNTFTPINPRSVTLDFALVPTTPTFSGISVGGVVRESVYGNLVNTSVVYISNISTSEYCITSTNIRGFYLFDNTTCPLISNRLYTIWGTSTGYGNSTFPSYQVVTP